MLEVGGEGDGDYSILAEIYEYEKDEDEEDLSLMDERRHGEFLDFFIF